MKGLTFRRKQKATGYDGAIQAIQAVHQGLQTCTSLLKANPSLVHQPRARKNMQDMITGLEALQPAIDVLQVDMREAIQLFRAALSELQA